MARHRTYSIECRLDASARPDARVTKMKDGCTPVAHKAEHAVDLESGAILSVTVQGADTGDTASMIETLIAVAEQVETVQPDGPGIQEVAGDKGTTVPSRCRP